MNTTNSIWHSLNQTDLLGKTESSFQEGLSSTEAAKRIEQFGSNTISQAKRTSSFVLFLMQFNQPLIYIMIIAGIVTACLKEFIDSSVIFGVVLANAIIGFIQESKARNAIESLSKSVTSEATVIREGKKLRILATELTCGDLVILKSGDKVPADLRLVQLRELQIDESTLTGESVPVIKQTEPLDSATVLADRTNMAFSSTLVTHGMGTGIVIAIGDETEIGKINQMIASVDVLDTPLTKRISHFSTMLLYIICAFAVVTFIVGTVRGESAREMFMAVVALAVGAIPEGLPAALTITLAIGVSKMAKRNAIIRKLPAVETLGSTSVICSDKTGTLTQNQMTVQEIFAGGKLFALSGSGYVPEGEFSFEGTVINPNENCALLECLTAGLLCNESKLVSSENDWKIEGDPTEGALITSAHKSSKTAESERVNSPRIDTIPFESDYQYMATFHTSPDSQQRVI